MVEDKGLAEDVADAIGRYIDLKGPPMEVLLALRDQEWTGFATDATASVALNELEILFGLAS